MKRSAVNFLIDVLTFFAFFAKVWTGFLIHYVLPPGGGRGRALTLWGMDRHDYGKAHFYLALAMIILIVVHLWLHWSWVCSVLSNLVGTSRPKRIRRAIYGMTLSAIIGLRTVGSLLWVKTQVKYAYGEEQGRHGCGGPYETNEPAYITGPTTLKPPNWLGCHQNS